MATSVSVAMAGAFAGAAAELPSDEFSSSGCALTETEEELSSPTHSIWPSKTWPEVWPAPDDNGESSTELATANIVGLAPITRASASTTTAVIPGARAMSRALDFTPRIVDSMLNLPLSFSELMLTECKPGAVRPESSKPLTSQYLLQMIGTAARYVDRWRERLIPKTNTC